MDAIRVEGIRKTYRVGVGRARVREMTPPPFDRALARLFPRWWTRNTFNALDDVTLSVPAGSSVGIVGHNGAGKTTLLKVVAGVTYPNAGTIAVNGRIAALIDALVGFHPDLTGRENTYLLGAMHGFGRRAMASRVDRILEFAEIDEMADTQLKRYSAGMAARLGFAIITALDVEILMVDEVLAVGDAAFQRKCIQWLDEYREGGGTLVFVSHNLSLVRNMTQRVVWLDHGRVMDDGRTSDVLGSYARAMEHRSSEVAVRTRLGARKGFLAQGGRRWGAGGARVDEVQIGDPSSNGGSLEISITYETSELDRAMFCVGFVNEAGQELGAATSPELPIEGEGGKVRCVIHPLPLRSGIYFPVVAILSPDGLVRDRWKLERAVVIDRDGDATIVDTFGPVDIAASWSSP